MSELTHRSFDGHIYMSLQIKVEKNCTNRKIINKENIISSSFDL